MEEATEQWIKGTVSEEDRQGVRDFFQAFYRNEPRPDEQPKPISYRALSGDGILRRYTGLFVERDSTISLFCCRRVPEYEEAETLKSEYSSLKGMAEGMQRIVLSFTDGLAAFEVVGDSVTPLYVSENVCRFFGFSREEWLEGMQKRTPIPEFVSRSSADPALFRRLLEEGEAEFPYHDLATNRERRIRAICSRRTPGAEPRYVMMYNVEESPAPKVRIRTFGYFDVFVEETPIAFKNEKAEELFALLVDRRGGFVSPEEAISILWEDEPVTPLTLARYRKVALRLKNTLTAYGVGDIMESVNGKRRLIHERVHCDLYEYLAGNAEYQRAFRGSYLSDYSWGEVTLGELTQGQGSEA
jgi:PAS domain-containing protein